MKLFLFKKWILYRRFINSAQIPCDKLYFSTSFPFILFFPFIMENPHRLLGPSAAHNVLIYVRQIPIKTSHFSFTVHYSGKFLFKKKNPFMSSQRRMVCHHLYCSLGHHLPPFKIIIFNFYRIKQLSSMNGFISSTYKQIEEDDLDSKIKRS